MHLKTASRWCASLAAASVLAGSSIHPALRLPAIAIGATSAVAGAQMANEFDHADPIPGQTPEAVLTGHPAETV